MSSLVVDVLGFFERVDARRVPTTEAAEGS
jgi:hypothetical protein